MNSVKELVYLAESQNKKISEIVLNDQELRLNNDKSQLILEMKKNLDVMRESYKNGVNEKSSLSGLSGGIAEKIGSKNFFFTPVLKKAMEISIAIAEHNACMGRIVACPTAGSCGILPGVLLSISEFYNIDEDQIVMSMFNASGICMIIAKNAGISGASGGCQAECGTASAIAASAAVELMGGTPSMCANACALAIKFIMGLTCDPVAGLVEVPCVKRNASCAINAFSAAEMALCGIESAIPCDEVIEAMNDVGIKMSYTLKETSLGGLAATKTSKEIFKKIK